MLGAPQKKPAVVKLRVFEIGVLISTAGLPVHAKEQESANKRVLDQLAHALQRAVSHIVVLWAETPNRKPVALSTAVSVLIVGLPRVESVRYSVSRER